MHGDGQNFFMVSIIHTVSASCDVSSLFFSPLLAALRQAPSSRSCPALEDASFIVMGVCKSVMAHSSGRALLQEAPLWDLSLPALQVVRSTWFEALASKRRLKMLKEVSANQCRINAQRVAANPTTLDRLASFPELDPFVVMAGDGHWHAAAVHDEKSADEKKC